MVIIRSVPCAQNSKVTSDMIADLISTYAKLFEQGALLASRPAAQRAVLAGNLSRAKSRLVARMTNSDYSKYAFLKVRAADTFGVVQRLTPCARFSSASKSGS